MDGGLYGLTDRGGAFDDGSFYRVGPGGEFSVLHSFSYANCGFRYLGATCYARATAGVMTGGGFEEHGGAYRITPAGAFTPLVAHHDPTRCPHRQRATPRPA